MPVKGGGGIGGPRKKPKPKSGVGAAIKQAGSRPAPRRPTPKPGARTVGKAVQKAGRPVAATTRKSGDAPQTRKQDTRKAAAYNRSKAGKRSRVVARRAEEKRQIRKALSLVEGASRRQVKQSGPNALQRAVRIPEKVPGALDRELRGKGVVLPAIGKAAKKVAEVANSNPYGSDVERSGIDIRGQMRQGPKRLTEDALNLAPSAVSGTYVFGRAGAKALTGDTKEAKEVIKGIQRDDPVYAAATGDFKRAMKLANEHPGFAAAEVFGVARGLDRGAGRTVRGTGRTLKGVGKATGSKKLQAKGEKIRRVAATETRPDAVVPGTNLRETRRYDRGLVTKTVQKRRDKKKTQEARDLRQRADNLERTHGGPTQASTKLRRDAAEKDPTVMKSGKVKRAVDVYEAASESNRRRKMADADEKIAEVTKGERGAAMNLVAQGIVKATPDDLRAYKTELERAYDTLDSASKRAANENLRELIDESLKAEKKKPGTLKKSEAAAKRYAEEVDRPLDEELANLGLIDRRQAEKAKLTAFAAREMGARRDDTPRLTDAGVKRFVAQEERARQAKAVSAARRREDAARRDFRKALANARVSSAKTKRTPAVRKAEAELRAARAALATAQRSARAQKRQTSRAEGGIAGRVQRAERSWLVRDKEYRDLTSRLGRINREKNRLRADLRQAERISPNDVDALRVKLRAASQESRRLASDARARADFLVANATARERASVIRAKRGKYAARAKEGNPEKRVAEMREKATVAERALSAERARFRGVAPKQADDLRRAMDSLGNARATTKAQRERAIALRERAKEVRQETRGKKLKAAPGIVDEYGQKLPTRVIAARAAQERDVPISYVSQAPNATSAGSYYRSSYQEPKYTGKARTEKPTQEGTFDASTEAVRARATKAANVIAAAENYRGFLKDFAVRDPDSGRSEVVSFKAAKDGAARLSERTGVDYRVVRATPWGVSKDQFARMLDDIGDEADPRAFKAFREQIDAGLKGEGDGPYAIIPETAARQLQEHMDVLSPNDAGKLAQAARASFSRTVLSLSPSPTAGNLVEGAFRALASRSGPTSRITYGRVIKRLREIDPEAAARFEDRTLGTGRVSLQTQRRFTEPQQFSDGPMRKAVAGVAAARKLPGPKQASAAWQAWTSLVFDRINNTMIERPAQKVMLGKAIRDSGLMNDGAMNTSRKAIEQAAQGLRGTAEQVRMADDLRDMYGAYRAFSPTKRRVIANYTPFLAWYLNAARFVGVVLPRDHPVGLAVIASAAQVTDDVDRQKARPGWLKGTLESGGVTWQATRNTPFGAFTDPLATGESLILPQISVLSAVAQGEDWKGKKLRNKDGSPYTEQQKIAYALGELMKSSVPAVAVPDRVSKYANKPSSLLNAVRVNVPKGRDSDGSPQVKATKRKKSQTPADPLARLDDLMSQQVDDDLERRLAELDEVVK